MQRLKALLLKRLRGAAGDLKGAAAGLNEEAVGAAKVEARAKMA